MVKTKDLENKVVATINGYEIVRSVCKKMDRFTEEISGHAKVFYDVVDGDGDLLESFKTLREAKAYCK